MAAKKVTLNSTIFSWRGKTGVMRLFRPLLSIAVLAFAAGSFAQDSQSNAHVINPPVALPAPTTVVMSTAEAEAKASGKNVLVIFHASWCGWCKKLDAFMNDPKFKQVFDDNFVTTKLTVLEDEKHKMLENTGGLDEMDKLGGKDSGLPLFAILDPDGNMLINSVRPAAGTDTGGNTGFPSEPEEIAHFLTMMQKGAPKITADQMKDMQSYLEAQAAALKAAAANHPAPVPATPATPPATVPAAAGGGGGQR
jgi:thioredoxin-related protein